MIIGEMHKMMSECLSSALTMSPCEEVQRQFTVFAALSPSFQTYSPSFHTPYKPGAHNHACVGIYVRVCYIRRVSLTIELMDGKLPVPVIDGSGTRSNQCKNGFDRYMVYHSFSCSVPTSNPNTSSSTATCQPDETVAQTNVDRVGCKHVCTSLACVWRTGSVCGSTYMGSIAPRTA